MVIIEIAVFIHNIRYPLEVRKPDYATAACESSSGLKIGFRSPYFLKTKKSILIPNERDLKRVKTENSRPNTVSGVHLLKLVF
jgi:hypothetical protein